MARSAALLGPHFDEIVAFHDRSPSPRAFLTH